jgi:VWFA-related protein
MTSISFQFILDQNGGPITNLNAANFEIYEDGVPAVITDVRPVSETAIESNIALVLERSDSMAGQPNLDLEMAATSFINLMPLNDFGEIINFTDWVSVDQPFTADKTLLLQAIQGKSPFGPRPLYDAICQAVFDTSRRSGRKAIIAMSDGSDNCSWFYKEEAIGYPHQAGIPVFTVGLGGSDFSPESEIDLQDIASQTRGLYYYAANSSELNAIYTKIANQLNGQVEIIFISPDPNKSNRTRNVTLVWHYGSFTDQIDYQYVY